jgi:hypothetical protein
MNVNMALRTGMTKAASGEIEASFRDVMQMESAQAKAAINAKVSAPRHMLEILAGVKRWACYPLALAAMPYVRWKKYKGSYLYCLAKKLN